MGIDSQNCPKKHRNEIWQLLAGDWKIDNLYDLCEEIGLDGLEHHIGLILLGKQKGRIVVNVDA